MGSSENPMRNLLVKEIPDRFHAYMTLALIEPLRYPSQQQQLESASRSFSIFIDNFKHTGKIVDSLGKEDPKVIAKAETVAKQVEVVTKKLDRIGSRYQSILNKKVAEYSKQMDEQYDAFYKHMVDNLFANIKQGNVTVPDKGPMDPAYPRNPKVLEGFEGAYDWSKFLIKGTLPSDNFETCRKIMAEYRRLVNEAQKLWEATKDTVLDTRYLYTLLFQHTVWFNDENEKPYMGGKRGKINIDFHLMEMFAGNIEYY